MCLHNRYKTIKRRIIVRMCAMKKKFLSCLDEIETFYWLFLILCQNAFVLKNILFTLKLSNKISKICGLVYKLQSILIKVL